MSDVMEFNQKIEISDQALTQEVSGEIVILDLQSEQYFSLDEVGTRVWQLLKENCDTQKVFEIMQAEYEVTKEQLFADIKSLMDDLIDVGLIKEVK